MKNKLFILAALFIAGVLCSGNCIAQVTVGSRVNDSTGTISISQAQIQQSVISTIPILRGKTMLGTQPVISAAGNASYLVLQVATAADTFNVAVPLTSASNLFLYNANGNNDVHVCKVYSDCNACGFGRDAARKIIGCYVRSTRRGSADAPGEYLIRD